MQERQAVAQARATLQAAIRAGLLAEAFLEVEVPSMVPAPGQEPHIAAFEAIFTPEGAGGPPVTRYLHTSPEYAMKRLLAEGFERIFTLCRVYRNGEIARDHNPEFTLLELYRAGADYREIMDDVERLVCQAAEALHVKRIVRHGRSTRFDEEFQRVTVRAAVVDKTGIDIAPFLEDPPGLAAACKAIGVRISERSVTFDDVFNQLFLAKVEPTLGAERPTFLYDYPKSMAALARLKPSDERWAERFELYAGGLELANGFSELTDAAEQRRRLVEEQEQRRAAGNPVYPLDEAFLEAVGAMPPSGGVALGIDRLLMLLLGKKELADVLLFPARDFRDPTERRAPQGRPSTRSGK